MEDVFVRTVERALDNYDLSTAIFYAEQYYSIASSSMPASVLKDSIPARLLAKAYYHSKKPTRTFSILKGCKDPDSRYLLAVAWCASLFDENASV